MKKDTKDLIKELKDYSDFKSFYERNSENIEEISLSEYLQNLIESKNLNKSEIVEKSEMSEVYAYQIISGIRKKPQRNKVLRLAFGMDLELEEVQNLLKRQAILCCMQKIPLTALLFTHFIKNVSY
ncbi:MAG: hypothetical protein LIO43_01780 [Clostridiales bacterium]|nr:hypothetical protein [Clostridiales bacterium]